MECICKGTNKIFSTYKAIFPCSPCGIGGQLKFDVEERIHYEIVTEEQFLTYLTSGIMHHKTPNTKKALPNPVISRKHEADRRQTKLLDINFFADGQIEWRPCRFNIYQSNPEIFMQEKYHRIFHDKVFSADMTLKRLCKEPESILFKCSQSCVRL